MYTRSLRAEDKGAALELLSVDIPTNLYQIDVLLRNPIQALNLYEWKGAFENDTLIAVSLSSGRIRPNSPSSLCVPFGDFNGCRMLGEAEKNVGGTLNLLGPKAPSEALYLGLGKPKISVCTDEHLYMCREQPFDQNHLNIRLAQISELDILEPMAAQMQVEDIGTDPRAEGIENHRNRIAHQIHTKHIWVADLEGEIVFSLNVGTHCPLGTQVGSIFVPSHKRNQGIATRAMCGANICFLRQSAIVTLLVRSDNHAAIRAYEKSNYKPVSEFLLAELLV